MCYIVLYFTSPPWRWYFLLTLWLLILPFLLQHLRSAFSRLKSFQVHLQIPAAAFQRVHLLLGFGLDFVFLIRRPLFFDKEEKEEEDEEEGEREARRKDPYRNALHRTMNFLQPFKCILQNAWVIHYSRFWSVTKGLRNEWWYLLPDVISLILLIPWPVYLY